MTDINGQIYERLVRLIPDLRELQPGDARMSKSNGFMALHLDVLSRVDKLVQPNQSRIAGELRIALHHSYEQNGDLVPDPDMEIRVFLLQDWNKAEALTYQDAFTYREVYPEPGKVDIRAKKEMNSFLAQWLKNCIDQGHSLRKEAVAPLQEVA
jgi:uncharacterized protein YqiB (DUF1249 family)